MRQTGDELYCATCDEPWPCGETRENWEALRAMHPELDSGPSYDLERPLGPVDPLVPDVGCSVSVVGLLLTLALAYWLLGCASTPQAPQKAPGEAYSCREVLAFQMEAERRYERIRHMQLIAMHGPDGMGQRASPAKASNRRAWAAMFQAARSQAWGEIVRWRSECQV